MSKQGVGGGNKSLSTFTNFLSRKFETFVRHSLCKSGYFVKSLTKLV